MSKLPSDPSYLSRELVSGAWCLRWYTRLHPAWLPVNCEELRAQWLLQNSPSVHSYSFSACQRGLLLSPGVWSHVYQDTWVLFGFVLFSRKPFHGCSEIRGLEPKNKNNNNLWWKSRCGAHFLLSYLQLQVKGCSVMWEYPVKRQSSRFILTWGKLKIHQLS